MLLVLPPRAAELAALMPEKTAAGSVATSCCRRCRACWSSLAVETGQEVKAGQELAVVEAMKMENVLRAERDGRVAQLHAKPGDSLAVDQVILEFE